MPEPSLLPGVNVLLEGPTGTGKTHSIGTLVDTGIETFVLFTESGLESLIGYYADRAKPISDNLHWHVLPKADSDFATMAETASYVLQNSQETLYKMNDPKRFQYNQFVTLLKALVDFPDDRTGKKFGDVSKWGPDRAFVMDSLTGLNGIAMSLIIGGKPIKSQTDWGLAQDQIEKLLRKLCDGCKCHFVLLSHVERETDQVYGGVKVTVLSLGKALPPKIPPMFSDVILAVREGSKYSWSTANPFTDLKARNLPVADGITPTFSEIINKWQSRGGRRSPVVK